MVTVNSKRFLISLVGMTAKALRFMLDGDRIQDENTPKMLELEENDQIDVMLETVGGFSYWFS